MAAVPDSRRGESRRVGIFGGTFDPVHFGHLAAAVNVRAALDLDVVLFVVANAPWQKVGDRAVTPAEERFNGDTTAIADVEGLEASAIEIERGGPSYTADTVAALRRSGPGDELFLIVGSDVAGSLGTWKRPEEIQSEVTLVVMERAGTSTDGVVDPGPPGWRSITVEIPALAISSTELRDRARAGRPLNFLLPDPVIRIIEGRGLYAGGR
jgi:nicotinate-nucleotide adenylyltransferase